MPARGDQVPRVAPVLASVGLPEDPTIPQLLVPLATSPDAAARAALRAEPDAALARRARDLVALMDRDPGNLW